MATLTRRWADALAGTGCVVRDTRKTTPGLRALEKYAVRCGGGANHRMGLSDAALVKDNHVLAAGGVAEAFAAVRGAGRRRSRSRSRSTRSTACASPSTPAPTPCCSTTSTSTTCAPRSRSATSSGRAVVLEASGGLTLEVARQVGETGVDYVAVGELTHSAKVLDLGLDLRERRLSRRRRRSGRRASRSATMTTSVSGVRPSARRRAA